MCLGQIPITEEKSYEIRLSMNKPRKFALSGKIKLFLSDHKEIIICTSENKVEIFIGDSPLPVFTPIINVVSIGKDFNHTVFGIPFSEEKHNTLELRFRLFKY